MVAPRVGAWIETAACPVQGRGLLSHPVWVRGLKRGTFDAAHVPGCVAPRVGAWIETLSP